MMETGAQEQDRIFAEEAAVVHAQTLLHSAMERKGISRADLARAMNVSRARVTQIFSDECSNLTVRLLARALWAVGEELALLTESDVRQFAQQRETGLAAASLPEWEGVLWTEINDPTMGCFEMTTANDNMLDGLNLARSNRQAYEEMAA